MSIDKHGDQTRCIEALKDAFEEVSKDLAEDGTETVTFVDISEVLLKKL